ncbi:pyridoxal phosphate-dependent deaminase, putative [hydrothermal vent metagenome]|uniref:Pyridoxal phosphate-dependent deaminase, putative n=1 Tax=hydrothermal vent metagenome TaxID=652676 RepID=A0A1W1BN89_9ZZZZ
MYRLSLPSRVDEIEFENHSYYLKRDDLIDIDFSGNKARKFHYYLQSDLPHIKKIISYGSNQSNAMYSLSVLAKIRRWEFDYYVDHIPTYLRENPQGNYAAALDNGMHIIEGEIDVDLANSDDILLIQEGGREESAEYGLKILADEIEEFRVSNQIEALDIFLPSGTGTTALYLQKHSSSRVFTTPCVGDESYLREQFSMLESDTSHHPTLLNSNKKYHFGKLYKEFYKIWRELQSQTAIEFDLLYDPKGWITLLSHREIFTNPILYIHQGGLIGNESMLPRYIRKYKEI